MTCLDLLQCYSQLLAQQVWALCLKSSAAYSQVSQMLKIWRPGESLLEICSSVKHIEFQKAVFGEANTDTSAFTRGTRRLIALIGMCNFAVISILCTLFPGVELVTFTPPENKEAISILFGLIKFPSGADITTSITTGHISLVSIATLGAIVGFYFTPGGKR